MLILFWCRCYIIPLFPLCLLLQLTYRHCKRTNNDFKASMDELQRPCREMKSLSRKYIIRCREMKVTSRKYII